MAKGAGDGFAEATGVGAGFDATTGFATGAAAATGFAAAFCTGFAVAFTAGFGAAFAVVAGFAAGLAADAVTSFFFEGAAAAALVIGVLVIGVWDFDFNDTDLEAAFLGVSLLFFVIAFSTPSAITFTAAIDNEPSSRWQAAATMKRARDDESLALNSPSLGTPNECRRPCVKSMISPMSLHARSGQRHHVRGDHHAEIANLNGTHHVLPCASKRSRLLALPLTNNRTVAYLSCKMKPSRAIARRNQRELA